MLRVVEPEIDEVREWTYLEHHRFQLHGPQCYLGRELLLLLTLALPVAAQLAMLILTISEECWLEPC